jgi:hypothetical protein
MTESMNAERAAQALSAEENALQLRKQGVEVIQAS